MLLKHFINSFLPKSYIINRYIFFISLLMKMRSLRRINHYTTFLAICLLWFDCRTFSLICKVRHVSSYWCTATDNTLLLHEFELWRSFNGRGRNGWRWLWLEIRRIIEGANASAAFVTWLWFLRVFYDLINHIVFIVTFNFPGLFIPM